MKNAVFWGVAPCIRSSETLVQSTTSTRRHTPEDGILHTSIKLAFSKIAYEFARMYLIYPKLLETWLKIFQATSSYPN
jgi:hypothetical protein